VSLRIVIMALCLGCFLVPLHADEPKHKSIDDETIANYKKLGGELGGFTPIGEGLACFSPGERLATIYLPGFGFGELSDSKLPKLPPVGVFFGLCFYSTNLSDEGLKELKDLKNLTCLYMNGTKVTGVGFKELKALNNLTTLCIGDTPLTDEGLKELKNFKNLKFLFLSDTKVTNAGVKELQEALPKCKISH
jgi:hypothetical protein